MTAFVILAAGRGTRIGRVGDSLHKSLVPLDGRAVLTHLFELMPADARLVICLGHRSMQIRDYVRLAHPELYDQVAWVNVHGWDKPGGGPGHSLLAAKAVVGDDDMIFTSCDTLWKPDPELFNTTWSWAATAPVPAGTLPERWCRIGAIQDRVTTIVDKKPGHDTARLAYTGLARIARADLAAFWAGVTGGSLLANERQVTAGLQVLADMRMLRSRHIHWIDVGDEQSYRRAVAEMSGYDWTKVDQATYVIPQSGRVVKFNADHEAVKNRVIRATGPIRNAVPKITGHSPGMMGYEFVPGSMYYDVVENDPYYAMLELRTWCETVLWRDVYVQSTNAVTAAHEFYKEKTLKRVDMLKPDLRRIAEDAISGVGWNWITAGVQPVTWHGDLNFGNLILEVNGASRRIYGIDWREDFNGELRWGDRRYDIGKLMAGCKVHWGRALRGDFRPWPAGEEAFSILKEWWGNPVNEAIGALSLINSAPLHAEPLDEILVARAAAWLEDIRA